MVGFVMIYWSVWRPLVSMARDVHLKASIPIHFFRYFGLTVLLPGVFNLAPAGFSQDYLFQNRQRGRAIPDVIATFGHLFDGAVIGNFGFDLVRANAAISQGQVEAVSFGKLFVSNPDLPRGLPSDQRSIRPILRPSTAKVRGGIHRLSNTRLTIARRYRAKGGVR